MSVKVITNNVPRPIVYGYELTEKERKEFDYLSNDDLESNSFVRYKGWLYCLSDFLRINDTGQLFTDNWHGYNPDSFFSGTVLRYTDNSCEYVIMGTYIS